MSWLILVGYLIPVVPVWRRVAYAAAWDGVYGRDARPDVGFGICAGFLAASVWPITVAIWLVASLVARYGEGFLKPPARLKAKEQQRQIDTQAARICQLEREVLTK